MKFGGIISALALAQAAFAAPPPKPDCKPDFELEGYAKHNPIGPTTGGAGGKVIEVSTAAELISAVAGSEPAIIHVSGEYNLTSRLRIGSNKSLIGKPGVHFTRVGISIVNSTNVIFRNIKISKILDNDCITIQNSTRVWIDHNEFTSDDPELALGPDFYDGLVDIVRGSDWVTVSWNYFHDHWKTSLVGNSDALREVDQGHLHITYHHNYFKNLGTRGPAGRFGHQHIYNNFYEDFRFQAIHSRSDNQVLVEGNVFTGNTSEALSTYGLVIPEDSPNTSPDGDFEIDGFANLGAKNDFGTAGVNITQVGNFTEAHYKFKLTPLHRVRSVVLAGAGLGRPLH